MAYVIEPIPADQPNDAEGDFMVVDEWVEDRPVPDDKVDFVGTYEECQAYVTKWSCRTCHQPVGQLHMMHCNHPGSGVTRKDAHA